MQLNITTDYAIRTILFLGMRNGRHSATTIAEEMKIPRGYLEKILTKLKKEEFISSDKGTKGGYYLNRSLREITIGDVVRVMEPDVKINRCLDEDEFCSLNAASVCEVRKYYAKIQTLMENVIFKVSLQDILDENYDFDNFIIQ